MSTELETNLRYILNEKTSKLIPENIKKDVEILNVTGTYEGGLLPTVNNEKLIFSSGASVSGEELNV